MPVLRLKGCGESATVLLRKRRAITSAWIIVSLVSAIITWAIMYLVYVAVFPGYVLTANSILGQFGAQYPQLNALVGNLTSQINAVFIIVSIGVFFFMLLAPYLFEPLSGGSSEPY